MMPFLFFTVLLYLCDIVVIVGMTDNTNGETLITTCQGKQDYPIDIVTSNECTSYADYTFDVSSTMNNIEFQCNVHYICMLEWLLRVIV